MAGKTTSKARLPTAAPAQQPASEELKPILQILETLSEDTSIPKNVRFSITRAKDKLVEQGKDENTRVTSSIHSLEEIVNDVNMPIHGRTTIWNLLSELEVLKEQSR